MRIVYSMSLVSTQKFHEKFHVPRVTRTGLTGSSTTPSCAIEKSSSDLANLRSNQGVELASDQLQVCIQFSWAAASDPTSGGAGRGSDSPCCHPPLPQADKARHSKAPARASKEINRHHHCIGESCVT
jgi:hypothetical protein